MKLCKDCRWFVSSEPPECSHPDIVKIEPVYGKEVRMTCAVVREGNSLCGRNGRLFEDSSSHSPIHP